MRLRAFVRQDFRAAFEEARTRALPFTPDVREAELVGAVPRDDDEVDSVRDEIRPEPKAFATDALDAVPRDRVAHALRDDDAEPRRRRTVLSPRDEEHEMRRRRPLSNGLDAQEVGAAAQPAVTPVSEGQIYFS